MLFSDYNYQTRRLLRDSLSQFWDQTQLNTWINKARNDICWMTGATRTIVQFPCIQGQEFYQYNTFILPQVVAAGFPAASINQVLQVSFLPNSSLRYPLKQVEFSTYNKVYRQLTTFQGWPTIWSVVGYQQFGTMPIPSSNQFTFEVDSIYTPNPLVNQTDQETAIPDPWFDLVIFRTAWRAEYYQAAYQDAAQYKDQFMELAGEMFAQIPMIAMGDNFWN